METNYHVRFSYVNGGGQGESKVVGGSNDKTSNDWVVVDLVDDDGGFVMVDYVEDHDGVAVRRSNEPLCLRENYF